jgi:hypothetical protein
MTEFFFVTNSFTIPEIFGKERFIDSRGNYVIIENLPREKGIPNGISVLFIDPHIQDTAQSEESQFTLHIPDIFDSLYIFNASTSLVSCTPKITIDKMPSLRELHLYANVNIELPESLIIFTTCFIDKFHSLPYGITDLKLCCEPKNIIYPDSITSIEFQDIFLTYEDIKRIPKQVRILKLTDVRLDTLYISDNVHDLYLDTADPVRIVNLPGSVNIDYNDDAKILIKDSEIKVYSRKHEYEGRLRVKSIKSLKEIYITDSYIELIQLPTDEESAVSERSIGSEKSNRLFREILIFSLGMMFSGPKKECVFYSSKSFSNLYNDDIESITMSISRKTIIIKELPKNLRKLSLRDGTFDIDCEYPAGLEKLKICSMTNNTKHLKNLPKSLKKLDISIDTGLEEELILPESLEKLVIRVGYKKFKMSGKIERIFPKKLIVTSSI